MIFSTAEGAPGNTPLSSLTEHSFGVRAVAFSHDSRWLCSIGSLHDGFVCLWSINSKNGLARLHSRNRCTSDVRDIAWIGNSVVSVGTRHVKVWRLEPVLPSSPLKARLISDAANTGPKTLTGRNCLLGNLMDAVFSCVEALSDSVAILCTIGGDICVLDDNDRMQQLKMVASVDFSISCMAIDNVTGSLWMGGKAGKVESLPLGVLTQSTIFPDSFHPPASPGLRILPDMRKVPDVVALGVLPGRIITVSSDRVFRFKDVKRSEGVVTVDADIKELPAHNGAILGVGILHQPNEHDAAFMTWSANGTVLFWSLDGTCKETLVVALNLPLYHQGGALNELKVLRASSNCDFYVTGDKSGQITLIRNKLCTYSCKAHDGDINDISMSQQDANLVLVASCGRDRICQLFRKTGDELSVLQTLDDHLGAVNQISFLKDGSTLVSSSADRTIIIRSIVLGTSQSVAFIPTRIITLKSASPVAFTTMPDDADVLIISTLDRQVHRYNISSGCLTHHMKISDPTSNELFTLSSLTGKVFSKATTRIPVLLGVSSTDKSIWVYDYENCSLLAKEHGHTEGISDIGVIEHHSENHFFTGTVISTGLDGTCMIWDLSLQPQSIEPTESSYLINEAQTLKTSAASTQPLRRILSKSEISSLQTSLEGSGTSMTPTRNQSPSRIRKKTSKHALIQTPKLVGTDKGRHVKVTSVLANIGKEDSKAQGFAQRGPEIDSQARRRPPPLDARHRPKSVSNLRDLALPAEQICEILRSYRKILNLSVDGLTKGMTKDLERELHLTIRAIGEKAERHAVFGQNTVSHVLNVLIRSLLNSR